MSIWPTILFPLRLLIKAQGAYVALEHCQAQNAQLENQLGEVTKELERCTGGLLLSPGDFMDSTAWHAVGAKHYEN